MPSGPQDADTLHYLGHYERDLPVSLARMMENAHDWEHLPHVHPGAFSSIELLEQGRWGWRARVGLPAGGTQEIELRVDAARDMWVSTVRDGMGAGTQIHTYAKARETGGITVDVRFYLPDAPADASIAQAALSYLTMQYTQLYDEDLALMQGRQSALDDRVRRKAGDEASTVFLPDPDPDKVHLVELGRERFCVRRWQDRWIVHGAVCPHLLGPLADADILEDGTVTCPWHGYRFDVTTGEPVNAQCRALPSPPQLAHVPGGMKLFWPDAPEDR